MPDAKPGGGLEFDSSSFIFARISGENATGLISAGPKFCTALPVLDAKCIAVDAAWAAALLISGTVAESGYVERPYYAIGASVSAVAAAVEHVGDADAGRQSGGDAHQSR